MPGRQRPVKGPPFHDSQCETSVNGETLWAARRTSVCSPKVGGRFLAFDLGAESGRAVLGQLQSGALVLDEVARFPNEPVRTNGSIQWDVLRLWLEMRRTFDRLDGTYLDSVGLDAWGCDFALLGERGNLLENPYHYRDTRHDGAMDAVCQRFGREKIYAHTGSQIIPINTIFQLYAACQATPRLIDAAKSLAMVPDLLNYWLTGSLQSEYTIASTSQMVDARTRTWARPLLGDLGLPDHLLLPLVEPGALLGELRPEVNRSLGGTPVVAPACHDTGSAFAAVWADGGGAYLSSGTWSLLGAEVATPIMTSTARDLNFTNEGGVCGTTRLLKNIAGMWLLQACLRSWSAAGSALTYDGLLSAAAEDRLAFRSLVDPDHSLFFHPPDMPVAIAGFCRQTGQPEPEGPAAFARAILESLAFKYRCVLESLEALTGTRFPQVRIVGGGSRNRLLNQLTADATGRTVLAGPVEATALGNIAMQMIATGAVGSLAEARDVIDRSFPVQRFEPMHGEVWDRHHQRFQEYLEAARV
jgi:rhamnulokinase